VQNEIMVQQLMRSCHETDAR